MLACALVLSATVLKYDFPPVPVPYNLHVELEGFIPLMGGREGKLVMDLGLTVTGEPPGKAKTNLTSLKIIFNDAALPFTVENVRRFFPASLVEFTPFGRILKNDVPDAKLPIRLPGLDPQHFPDITYLPVEFPEGGVDLGVAFGFKRVFSGSPVEFRVVPKSITPTLATFDLRLDQKSTYLEDDALQVTEVPEKAVATVESSLQGTGTANFDPIKCRFRKVSIQATQTNVVKPTDPGAKEATRALKATVEVTST